MTHPIFLSTTRNCLERSSHYRFLLTAARKSCLTFLIFSLTLSYPFLIQLFTSSRFFLKALYSVSFISFRDLTGSVTTSGPNSSVKSTAKRQLHSQYILGFLRFVPNYIDRTGFFAGFVSADGHNVVVQIWRACRCNMIATPAVWVTPP